MFVWDQYVISGDVPGYHEDLLPIIAAIIFMILRDQLMAVESVTFFFIRETEFFYFLFEIHYMIIFKDKHFLY